MPAIRRLSDTPYRWDIIEAPLSEVANQEKLLPPRLHQRRRLRRHRGGPPVFGAAHRCEANPTIQEWPARLWASTSRHIREAIRITSTTTTTSTLRRVVYSSIRDPLEIRSRLPFG
jgi:hypothetical protein